MATERKFGDPENQPKQSMAQSDIFAIAYVYTFTAKPISDYGMNELH